MMNTELKEMNTEELELVNGGGSDILHVESCKDCDLSHGLPFYIEAKIVISAYWNKLWD